MTSTNGRYSVEQGLGIWFASYGKQELEEKQVLETIALVKDSSSVVEEVLLYADGSRFSRLHPLCVTGMLLYIRIMLLNKKM